MNHSRLRLSLLAPLLAVLALLLGLAGSASAAFNHAATDPHYGNFLLQTSEAPARITLAIADPDREIGVWLYDSTLGVPVYVQQNPWTSFDPLGLAEKNVGEVYVHVNHRTKEYYVGETGRTTEIRANEDNKATSKHRYLRNMDDTVGYSRTVTADDARRPGGLSARDREHARMAVERELHDDAEATWGKKGYKSLNDKGVLLNDEHYERAKGDLNPKVKAREKPKAYFSKKNLLGSGRKMKPISGGAGLTRGLALGGAGAVLGVAALYSDGDDIGDRMVAWASDPWANEGLEHDIALDIGGNLGTVGYLTVGKALQEARERSR